MRYKVRNKKNGQEFEATEEQVEAFKKGQFARRFTYTPIESVPTPPEAKMAIPKEAKPRKKRKSKENDE